MSYATERLVVGHEAMWIVEMDLDYCSLTYGVGPCTAAGAAGSECYNTRFTTQDSTNYDGGGVNVFTYRFCETSQNVPPNLDAIPMIESVDMRPTTINHGQGFSSRGRVTITFRDGPHDDRGTSANIDKYVNTRAYDPATQGTFWGKFLYRNPYYVGRIMRVRSGFTANPWDWTKFETRTFFIESIIGPSADGIVTVVGKDVLKLADDDRSQCPAASSGYLSTNITAVAAVIDLLPAGIVAAEYPASGTIRIGSEVITYSGVAGDQLTGCTRGADGTEADTHDADDTVQLCVRYTDANLDDVVEDLLKNYADVPAAYITKADWTAQVNTWLASSQVTTLITEPTGVRQLISELCSVFMFDLWWDEVDSQIRMYVLQPARTTPDSLTDNAEVLAGSFEKEDLADNRVTQIWVMYNFINPTEPMDEDKNFHNRYIALDSDAEDTTQFDGSRAVKFYNRWSTNAGDAIRLAERTRIARRNTPRIFKWRSDVKDDIEPSDTVSLEVAQIIDGAGAVLPTNAYVISKKEIMASSLFEYQAIEDTFASRYMFIGPNTLNDYDVESDVNKRDYGFISANAAPYFADETDAYLII